MCAQKVTVTEIKNARVFWSQKQTQCYKCYVTLQIKLSCDSDGFVTVLPINTARLGPKLLIFGRHMTNTGSSKASLLPTHQMLLLAFNSHLT